MKALINLLVPFFLTIAIALNAQDVKLKKKVVYYNNIASCKMEGTASTNKGVDLIFTDMNGKEMFNLKYVELDTKIPILPVFNWQEIKFKGSGKIIKLPVKMTSFNKKKVFKELVTRTSPQFFDAGQPAVVRESLLIENDSTTTKIEEQALRIENSKAGILEVLKGENRVPRNVKAPILMKRTDFNPTTLPSGLLKIYKIVDKQSITQDGVVIGSITKEKDIKFPNSADRRYIVYKKVTKPIEINGEKTTDIIAAILEVRVGSENPGRSIYVIKDDKKLGINGANQVVIINYEAPYQNLVEYLVKLGYL
ncbi:hypothetical protein [Flavivirga spongiicola]|uniref:Uncharacterized protein n=1 Tax=Flavivirga spongiicola TaxID=421621 RepID=A0ABU7XWD2_9FLAO|nr:hypothetical protein [Flavivirga sp. MEBiC05379]MDO5980091.1 hypothetical protein [Flavivirga sp. MEBiC05379]